MKNQKNSYQPSTKRVDAIFRLIPETKGKTILDIGCADGALGKLLKNRTNQVYGVDINKTDLKKAREVLDKVYRLDLNKNKIPIKSASIDIVVCSEVIEHLLPGNRLLPEATRILRKDGVMILTTPNFLYWGHRLQFLLGKFEYYEQGPFDQTHVHFFTYSTLKEELIKKNGFKIIDEQHVLAGKNKLTNLFLKKFPALFAYQFVVKCIKSSP